MTFDKSKVVPAEYVRVLDTNIKFHFLDESGKMLHTIDDSDFNIIISNNQKIIVKKKHKQNSPTEELFDMGNLLGTVYGSEDDEDDTDPFLEEAIKTVVEVGQASTSFIQRRFKVGYARARKNNRSNGSKRCYFRLCW